MNIKSILLKALEGVTPSQPCDLTVLIERVDAREKMVPTLAEINEGLRSLIQSGKVIPVNHGYAMGTKENSSRPQTQWKPILPETYDRAVKDYKERFAKRYKELNG